MPSTTALLTALTGLNANARTIDVVGSNIANVNTTAYKSSRLQFANMFSRNVSLGTAPGDTTGGTNPYQIGLGVKDVGTQRDMGSGTPSATGDSRDLAVDGKGFFIVNANGRDLYTRAGAFRQNSKNDLITPNGEKLRGFGVDAAYNIVPGALVDINIPIGTTTIAEQTTTVGMSGNLNANGLLPTAGSQTLLKATPTLGFVASASAAPAPTPPNRVEATTRLIDIEDPLLVGSGTSLFTAGQRLQVRGAERGNKTIPTQDLAITATTTIADFNSFLSDVLGINTTAGNNPDGKTPGASVNPVTGELQIVGNVGSVNNIDIEQTDIRLLDSAGTVVRYPFSSQTLATADGESVRTTLIVFDSLGTPVGVDVSMSIQSKSNTGTTWRYTVESPDDSDLSPLLTSGTVSFDNNGKPVSSLPVPVTIDRAATGSSTPLSFNLFFSLNENQVTSLTDDRSQIAATFRDGSPIGSLSSFSVGSDGTISGSFTNGLNRRLGQVALATFANAEGLQDLGNNLYATAANSGSALVTAPGSLGAGNVVGGALESSNVDLGSEFIKLIQSSTGYSANSRVIRTTEELMQQLLVLGR
jgi:flagellar hook protein FlgE